jgi:hypothetical protein
MARLWRAGPERAGQGRIARISGILGVVLGSLAYSGPAGAGAAALMAELDRWLDANSAYPARADAPEVMLIEAADARTRRGQASRGGRLRALYDEAANAIYLVRPWSARDVRDASVLLHEMVHHRQATAKHWYCPGAQEWDAYKLQEAWLSELGVESGLYWPAIALESSCTPRDIHPD